MKVLVGIDGSEGSFAAAWQAARYLDPARDEMVLYYSPPTAKVSPEGEFDPKLLERGRQAMADVVFAEAVARLPSDLHAKVTTMVGKQSPRTGVLSAADAVRADLIAVGARGVGPIERLLLGSTSQSVLQSARVPVLVARPTRSDAATTPPRVLVACDGSETDDQIAAAVNQLTWPTGTQAKVITVVESQYAGQVPAWLEKKARSPETEAMAAAWQHEFEADKQKMRERIKSFCHRLPAVFQCEPLLVEGHAAEQIMKQGEAMRADLLVLGTRATGPLARWLIGSTSEKVLSHSNCSVLLVRRHPTP
jgi:nucleotide-binding universal stress UspA family protein